MNNTLDWLAIDKWLTGEAFVGSRLDEHLYEVCERIGPRWAGTEGDFTAGRYIVERFEEFGLTDPRSEKFELKAWDYSKCEGRVADGRAVKLLPMIHCPPIDVRAPLVDVGFGMPHELDSVAGKLPGSIAVINVDDEPFSDAVPLPERLRVLASSGCVAAVAVEGRAGGNIETMRATDKRWNDGAGDVLPHAGVELARAVAVKRLARGLDGQPRVRLPRHARQHRVRRHDRRLQHRRSRLSCFQLSSLDDVGLLIVGPA